MRPGYVSAVFLLVLALAGGFFGPRYEISKIPQAQRDKMSDFDWIGAEWVGVALLMLVAASLVGLTACIRERSSRASDNVDTKES